MSNHVKASPRGSTPGHGNRLVRTGPSLRGHAGSHATSRLFGLTLLAAALCLALASTAFAARSYESQLTEANTGTAFSNPFAVTVDGGDNLWVSDIGRSTVTKLDSTGAFVAENDGTGAWGTSPHVRDLAFGSTASLVYAVDSNLDDVWGLNLDTTYAGVDLNTGLGGGCCFLHAGVDNSGGANDGNIYVGSSSATVTRVDGSGAASNFSASASYISGNQLTGTPDHAFTTVNDVAVDASGDVYVVDPRSGSDGEVDRFDSTGTFVRAYTGSLGNLSALAIDPTSGNVLVGDDGQGVVHEFDPSGAFIGDTDGSGTPDGSISPQGLAVDSTGRLYVADASHPVVDVFGAGGPPPVTHDVTVNCTGAGTGSVSPTGCGATGPFVENGTAHFTATPAAHNTFTGWTVDGDTGACPGTGTCDVPIGTSDHTVEANFEPIPQHDVDVSLSGAGTGTVASDVGAISCPGTCTDHFDENSTVTLTATPDVHNTFTGWTVDGDTGACPGTDPCAVPVGTADHAVIANFEPIPQHTITVTVTGSGLGLVNADSGDISGCLSSGGTCSGSYDEGATVTLTTLSAPHNAFTGWSDACSGTGDCVITVTADTTVTATFEPITHTLTVSKAGTGGGTVTSAPTGIDCGSTCASSFDEGSSVTLTAAPAAHSTFTGWSGPGAGSCPGTGTCNVTIPGANTSVTATFAQDKPTVVTTAGATGITQHAATVAGTVNPNAADVTDCHVEYGKTTAYGSQAPCSPASPGAGTSAIGVSAALSGLTAGTTYHFRVVGTNAGGTTNGSDQTFQTLADTCQTNTALCPPPPPPPPPPTCATKPSLCPPSTPGALKLDVAVAKVTDGKAAVKLSCTGDTACSGTVKVTAKVKVRKGRKTVRKTLTIGKATVDIAAGESETVKIRLSRTARKLLAKKGSLKATLTGPDLKHAIVLKAKKRK